MAFREKSKRSESSRPSPERLSENETAPVSSDACDAGADIGKPQRAEVEMANPAKLPSENPNPVLRDSDPKFSNIVKASPMGILLWQLESDGRLVLVGTNPAADRILGVDCTQFIGRTIEQAFPPLADTELPEIYRKVATTGTPWHRGEFAYKDAQIKGIYEVYAFQTSPDQVAAMFNDISDRKETEDNLRAKAADEALILRSVPMVLYSTEASGDFGTTWTSGRVEEITGIEGCRFIDEPNFWASRLHPGDRDKAIQTFRGIPETGSCSMEYRWQHADGSWMWFLDQAVLVRDKKGQPKEIIGTWLDITKRKRAEEILQKERDFISAVLGTAGAMVVVLDSQGRIVRFNRACEQTTGYSFEEVEGKYFWALLLVPEEIESVKEVFEDLRGGQFPNEHKNYWVAKDGTRRWISWSNTAIIDGKGKVEYVIGTGIDITERKQAQEEISRLARFPSENPNPVLRISNDGMVLYSNQASGSVLRAWNYRRGEPVSGSARQMVLDALSSGRSQGAELECNRRILSLTFAPVADSNYVNIYGLDITERKQAEQALKESKDRLEIRVKQRTSELSEANIQLSREVEEHLRAQEAVESERKRLYSVMQMLPGFVILRDRNYLIRFANDRFLELFSEPIDRPCHTLLHSRDEPCEQCPAQAVLETRTPGRWEENAPDGRIFEVWGYPFTDLDGSELVLELGIEISDRRELEAAILKISEDERQRFGQDLHDSLGQMLSGISCLSQALHSKLKAKSAPEAAEAKQIESFVVESINLARSMAKGVSPVGPEPEGLMIALREMTSNVETMFNVSCVFQCPQPVLMKDNTVAVHLYRIAQEAAHNAARHGNANNVTIELTYREDEIVLAVEDDGVGLAKNINESDGLGLRIMNYRARTMGASLNVQSRSQGGTRVICRFKRTPQEIWQ